MRSRLLVIATLVGGIVLFAWQSISHGLLGLPEKGMRQFPNDSGTAAAARAVRALAPENGVYFSQYGILAAIDISADFRDKTQQFVPMMLKQIVLDFAVVCVLALLFDRIGSVSVTRSGLTYSLLALTFGGLVFLSNAVWWNYPAPWTLGNVADQVIGFFLVGVTLAALHNRFGASRVESVERPGVRAQAGLGTTESAARVSR